MQLINDEALQAALADIRAENQVLRILIEQLRSGDLVTVDGTGRDGHGSTARRNVGRLIQNFAKGAGVATLEGYTVVGDCVIRHCDIGVLLVASDSIVRDCLEIVGHRLCGHVTNWAGGIKSSFTHYYGASQCAFWNENGQGLSSDHDNFSDAPTGFHAGPKAILTRVTGAKSIHCWLRNFLCESEVSFANSFMSVYQSHDHFTAAGGAEKRETIGCDWRAAGCSWQGGNVLLDWEINPHHPEVPKNYRPGKAAFRLAGAHQARIAGPRIVGAPKFGGQTCVLFEEKPTHDATIDIDVAAFEDAGDAVFRFKGEGSRSTGLELLVHSDAQHKPTNIFVADAPLDPSVRISWKNTANKRVEQIFPKP